MLPNYLYRVYKRQKSFQIKSAVLKKIICSYCTSSNKNIGRYLNETIIFLTFVRHKNYYEEHHLKVKIHIPKMVKIDRQVFELFQKNVNFFINFGAL